MQEPDLDLARILFEKLQQISSDGMGITRDTYGSGEQKAHDLIERLALEHGLEVELDDALNLYVTLPGRDRTAARVMTGSHLDSVSVGGNYDGAVGVVAGMSVLVGWRKTGFTPPADTTLMVIRAEESCWFPISYIGSKAAFGQLPKPALDVVRADTGRSLSDHLSDLGGHPERIAQRIAWLDPAKIACFIEVHIEQGPVLIEAGEPVGLVTGIRGSFRYRNAHAIGQYTHSGATPRRLRRDAVLGVARLVSAMSEEWARLEAEGNDLTVTFGRFETDPERADFSKVSGAVDFCIDVRSSDPNTLAEMECVLKNKISSIAAEQGIEFHLGVRTSSKPALMEKALRAAISTQAADLGFTPQEIPSGAGHDSSVFANEGVPTAMIFLRNANGSHNPDESIEFEDFVFASKVLARVCALPANEYSRNLGVDPL
jgi:N-carbamoyl-L-amino-acid hydrolase